MITDHTASLVEPAIQRPDTLRPIYQLLLLFCIRAKYNQDPQNGGDYCFDYGVNGVALRRPDDREQRHDDSCTGGRASQ